MKGRDGPSFLYGRADSRVPGRAEPLLLSSCTNRNKGCSSEVKIQLKLRNLESLYNSNTFPLERKVNLLKHQSSVENKRGLD